MTGSVRRSGLEADDAALVRAIVERPLEDAPRAVYADVLVERGDPRGELIQLQLLGARADGRQRARARDLLEAHAGGWLAPHGGAVVLEGSVFERGFLHHAVLGRRMLAAQVTEAAITSGLLDTVATVEFRAHERLERVLRARATAHGLRERWVDAVPTLEGWRGLVLPVERLALEGAAASEAGVSALAAPALPRLEVLVLRPAGDAASLRHAVERSAVVARMRGLEVAPAVVQPERAAAWLDPRWFEDRALAHVEVRLGSAVCTVARVSPDRVTVLAVGQGGLAFPSVPALVTGLPPGIASVALSTSETPGEFLPPNLAQAIRKAAERRGVAIEWPP